MFVRYGLPFIDQNNGGNLDGMIDALSNLAGLIDNDTIIIPGHGQLSSRDDLLEYRNMLVVIRGKLVRAKVQEGIDQLARGEFVESTDETLDDLLEEIEAEALSDLELQRPNAD